jgi:putative transposase
MPVPQKKSTTSTSDPETSEQAAPKLPDQHSFHQHLREQIRSAVQAVMEEVMREELTHFLGAAWGRVHLRAKAIAMGATLAIWRPHQAPLKTCMFPEIGKETSILRPLNAIVAMSLRWPTGSPRCLSQGRVTQKVGEVAQTLMGVAPSASTVSRLQQTLTEQFETWRERPLQEHWRILYLDGVHFDIRHGDQVDSTIILTALGVDLEGNKEVLALRACAEEDKDGWSCLLHDLRQRGATQIDLLVTDGHEGLLAAIAALFPATPRQRCVVHKQRNVMNAIRQQRT